MVQNKFIFTSVSVTNLKGQKRPFTNLNHQFFSSGKTEMQK